MAEQTRNYNEHELRTLIIQKETRICNLQTENASLKERIVQLENLLVQWQKYRWNKELAIQSKALSQEIQGLTATETRILTYLASKDNTSEERHVRGVSRGLGLYPSIVSVSLKRMQLQGLVRATGSGRYKRNYVVSKDALDLINTYRPSTSQ